MSTMLFGAAEFNKSLNSWEKEDESSTMSNVESTHLMLCDTYAFNNNNEPLNWKLNNIKLYDSMFGTTRQNLLNYLLFLNPDADISNPYDNIDIALKHSTLKNLVIPGLDLKNITLKSRLFRPATQIKNFKSEEFFNYEGFYVGDDICYKESNYTKNLFTLLDSKYNNPDTKNTCTGEDENPLDEDKQKLINDILNLVGQLKTLKDDKVDEAKNKNI